MSTLTLNTIKKADLTPYVGKDIKDICTTGFDDAKVNHCAHFVSHVLDLRLGLICGSMKWATRGTGTSLRVNEIYNSCALRGPWSERPADMTACMVFVTRPGNLSGGAMGSHPRKHIGIFIEDTIWHYSNGKDEVTTDTPESFHARFKRAYGKDATLYFGKRVNVS